MRAKSFRHPFLAAIDNMHVRNLRVWKEEHSLVIGKTIRDLDETLSFKEVIQDNLVVWFPGNDEHSRSSLTLIRNVQLEMRDKHTHQPFTFWLVAASNSIYMPRKKSKKNFPQGDLWCYDDPAFRTIEMDKLSAEEAQYFIRHFSDPRRLYVITNRRASELDVRDPEIKSILLPDLDGPDFRPNFRSNLVTN